MHKARRAIDTKKVAGIKTIEQHAVFSSPQLLLAIFTTPEMKYSLKEALLEGIQFTFSPFEGDQQFKLDDNTLVISDDDDMFK